MCSVSSVLLSLPLSSPALCFARKLNVSRWYVETRISAMNRESATIEADSSVTRQRAAHTRSSQMSSKSRSAVLIDESAVPHTFASVMRVFLSHPSAAVPVVAICALLALRLQQPLTLLDIPVAAGVAFLWLIQEWVVHKYALHSEMDWKGKTIHEEHHQTPYFHVSLDPPELICSVMAVAAVVFFVLFQGGPLSYTATAAYYTAGLVYEWLHYVVHTRWVPPAGWLGGWLRAVRRHHMLHHCRNEAFWLSFCLPAVDAWFGTLPASASSVPLTAMARKGHVATAAAGKPGHTAGAKPASSDVAVLSNVPAAAARR